MGKNPQKGSACTTFVDLPFKKNIMPLEKLKKLIEKGIKGSAEKQLKLFLKNKKTRKIFYLLIK